MAAPFGVFAAGHNLGAEEVDQNDGTVLDIEPLRLPCQDSAHLIPWDTAQHRTPSNMSLTDPEFVQASSLS